MEGEAKSLLIENEQESCFDLCCLFKTIKEIKICFSF